MSEYAATQIPKPKDEHTFERQCEVLWRRVIKDPNLKIHGRRGQRQHGVDLVGNRDGDPERIVGVQCKLRGDGVALTEAEVTDEVSKALTFKPPLSEYIIVTTASDDAKLDRLARELSISVSEDRSKNLNVQVFGWGSLEREIQRYPDALRAFDPSHTPHGDLVVQKLHDFLAKEDQTHEVPVQPATTDTKFPYQGTVEAIDIGLTAADALERQIDNLVELIETHPEAALASFKRLQESLEDGVSDHVRFRVLANIAACKLRLGDEEAAAQGFVDAFDLDPDNPKAIANKAVGLHLQGDWPALKAFAEPRLKKFPENATLAACFVRGAVADASIGDPLALLPEAVLGTTEVDAAHIQWLRDAGTHGDWWEAAISAHDAHPDDKTIAEVYAAALLDRALDGKGLSYGQALSAASQADVEEAVRVLEKRWGDVLGESESVRGEFASVAHNLMVAYQMQLETTRVVKLGTQALKMFPTEASIAAYTALALLAEGEFERAESLVSDAEVCPQTASVLLDVRIANERWDEVFDLVDNHLDAFQESERERAQAAKACAEAELAPPEQRRSIMEVARDWALRDPRALTMLARGARVHGLESLADGFFSAAKDAVEQQDGEMVVRFALAMEAMDRRDLATVVNLLVDHVSPERDSPALRILARALAFRTPIRDAAIQFFQRLHPEVRDLPAIQSLEGCLHYNRGVPGLATALLEAAFEHFADMESLMVLIQAHIGAGDEDAARTLVHREGVDGLPGGADARIKFCHVCLEFGEPLRALELGYETLLIGQDDEEVVTGFLTLVLKATMNLAEDHGSAVARGAWVRLVGDSGSTYEALVGEAADRPWGQREDPSNPFLVNAMGLQVGGSFEWTDAIGRKETWTVSEVKPRWLRAFHSVSSNFSQRFPSANAFAVFPVKEDDIQPALDHVRRVSESERKIADLYLVRNIPLAVVARHYPWGPIGYAGYLTSIGEALRTCQGNAYERAHALDLIENNGRKGAVLDALTAWWVAALDVFEVLEERLGPLAMPAVEQKHFLKIIHRFDESPDQEAMGLSYRDGEYYREVLSPESQAAHTSRAKELLALVEKHCELVPYDVPDDLSEDGEALLEVVDSEDLAPVIVAGSQRLLLCEDQFMRQLGETAFGTKGVWLQAVLLSAAEAGTMPLAKYREAVVFLAANDHEHVTVNLPVLLAAFQDDNDDLVQLRILCKFVGNQSAEPSSHIGLSAEFINTIWGGSTFPDLKIQRATGIVLEALLLRNRRDDWSKWGAWLYGKLSGPPRKYLENWCRGHFVPYEDLVSALRTVPALRT